MSGSLVIVLHGVGNSGAGVEGAGRGAGAGLPSGTEFTCPDAPDPFDGDRRQRQWFSVAGVTPENRPARVAAARPAFDALIGRLIEARGLADRLDRVALVGFSQGAIMALDAVATGRWPVSAVVAFSGRLASADPLTPARETPVLLTHGTEDTAIPDAESFSAMRRLTSAGLRVTALIEPRLGHSISAEGLRLARDHLARALPVGTAPVA